MAAQLRHQFGGNGGIVAVFALLGKFVTGVVMVGGEFMIETAFGNQPVERVVGEAVAGAVFIGETDKAAGFIVVVAKGMAYKASVTSV